MAVFAFAYDARKLGDNNAKLVAFVKRAGVVSSWTTPFDGCFFIQSNAEERELTEMFIEFLGDGVPFVVMQFHPGVTGVLQDSVWKWLRNVAGASPVHLIDGTPLGAEEG